MDEAAIAPEMPLLWVLRDVLDLTGRQAVRSCVAPASSVAGKAIRTIEDLGTPQAPHALQQAWVQHNVPQCGYCQGGMLKAAAALLQTPTRATPTSTRPSPTSAAAAPTRARAAIYTAATLLQ